MHPQRVAGNIYRQKMADGPAGFHFDELNKIRVLEPEISQQTQELKEECKEFVDSKSESVTREIFFGKKLTLTSVFCDDRKQCDIHV